MLSVLYKVKEYLRSEKISLAYFKNMSQSQTTEIKVLTKFRVKSWLHGFVNYVLLNFCKCEKSFGNLYSILQICISYSLSTYICFHVEMLCHRRLIIKIDYHLN